jgi:hypothetical protein
MKSKRNGWFGVALAATACAVIVASGGVARAGTSAAGNLGGASGPWGTAFEIPGSAALNAGGQAAINQVSCSSPGNCAAGGYYTDGQQHLQAVVASESHGRWGRAEEVPGTAALNGGGVAQVYAVSCAASGDCAAAGSYLSSPAGGVFVVSETNGHWGQAIEIPGLDHLNAGPSPTVGGLDCPAPGQCLVAGDYTTSTGSPRAFVASEVRGHWGRAIRLLGAGLRASNYARIAGAACTAPGDCTVAGMDRPDATLVPFAVSEHDGVWGTGTVLAGSAQLGSTGGGIDALACPAAGDCVAGGSYGIYNPVTHIGRFRAFLASEHDGTWGPMEQVPGSSLLNSGDQAGVQALSCGAVGSCTAGGGYSTKKGFPAFLVSETDGRWGRAFEVPGLADPNTAAQVLSVSCPSAGNCVAGGYYDTTKLRARLFVISQVHGVWEQAIDVPGVPEERPQPDAGNISVSCPVAGRCTIGGEGGVAGRSELFVDSQR